MMGRNKNPVSLEKSDHNNNNPLKVADKIGVSFFLSMEIAIIPKNKNKTSPVLAIYPTVYELMGWTRKIAARARESDIEKKYPKNKNTNIALPIWKSIWNKWKKNGLEPNIV
mgnify:CR=1 FL=1